MSDQNKPNLGRTPGEQKFKKDQQQKQQKQQKQLAQKHPKQQENDTKAAVTIGNNPQPSDTAPLSEIKTQDNTAVQIAADTGKDQQPWKPTSLPEIRGTGEPGIEAVGKLTEGFGKDTPTHAGINSMDIKTRTGTALWTNVLPLAPKVKLSLYEISCQPKVTLTKLEEQWLVQAFLKCCHIEPCYGRLVFVDSKHFMTFNHLHSFDGEIYKGIIDRHEYRRDDSYKRTYTRGQKVWSKLSNASPTNDTGESHVVEDLNGGASSSLGSFQAWASCRVIEHLDFVEMGGKAPAAQKFASALQQFYIPRNPAVIPGKLLKSEDFVVHGNKTFDFTKSGRSIGSGLECRFGTTLSVRPSSNGLTHIATPCKRVFYAPLKLSTFIAVHKPNFVMDSSKDIQDLNDVLRGLRVKIRQANGVERLTSICEVSSTCPTDTMFRLADSGTLSSVEDYFAQKHNVSLTGVDQPCINVGSARNPQYFPTSACHIMLVQSFGKRLPPQAQVDVDKLQTSERQHSNGTNAKQVNKGQTADRSVSKRRLQKLDQTATYRGLPEAYNVNPRGLTKIEPERLSFELGVPKRPETRVIDNPFVLFLAQVGNGPSLSRTVEAFSLILKKKVKDLGMTEAFATHGTCALKLSESEDQWRHIVRTMMELDSYSKDRIPMVLAVIDGGESNQKAYKKVKTSFAIQHGFQSSCISTSTVKKAHSRDIDDGLDKYAGAVLRKVLAKARGQSQADERAVNGAQVIPTQEHATLFVGFHVAHLPSSVASMQNEGKLYPRMSAVTVATKFLGEDGPYKVSTELLAIEKDGLHRVLKNHIQKLDCVFGGTPDSRIIIFRSGVSQLTARENAGSNGFKLQKEREEDAADSDNSATLFTRSQGSDKQGSHKRRTFQNSIISEEEERFRSYCTDELHNTTGVYITVETPTKLKFYDEEGVPLTGAENTETGKRERVAWVIQSDVGDSADREIFFMKETKGVNRHYPLRLKVHSLNGSLEQTALEKMVCKSRTSR